MGEWSGICRNDRTSAHMRHSARLQALREATGTSTDPQISMETDTDSPMNMGTDTNPQTVMEIDTDFPITMGTSTDPQMVLETDADSAIITRYVGDQLSRAKLRDIPSAKLTDKNLATILHIIYRVQSIFETRAMNREFDDIKSCQKAISTISGLADTLRDAHDQKSYHRICSMGKCSPISQSTHLTPYTRGTPSAAPRDANGFARNGARASPIPIP